MTVVPLFGGKASRARFRYKCASCDQIHEGLPDITFEMPDMCHDIEVKARSESVLLTSDFCIMDGHHYFIRCVMEAPVHGFAQRFGWGVWCKVDWKSYKLCWDRFDESDNFGRMRGERSAPLDQQATGNRLARCGRVGALERGARRLRARAQAGRLELPPGLGA